MVSIGDGQEYAVVEDLLGNGRARLFCEDRSIRLGRIRGSLRRYSKKQIIVKGDLVIATPRDFGDADVRDIVHKYTYEETCSLMQMGMLPKTIQSRVRNGDELSTTRGEDYVVFMDGDAVVGSDSDADVDAI